MKVLVRGPALTRTGYGEHCRFVLRSLRELEGIDIYVFPVNWGNSAWVWENNEERQWLDDLIKKTAIYTEQGGQYDVSVQVTIPNEWQKMAPINIGVTAGIETNKVAPLWLQKVNEMDKVITISEHSKKGFVDTFYEGIDRATGQRMTLTCNKDIDVVHYPVKTYDKLPDLNLDLPTKFNFLTVAQWGPRKNIGATISWFVEEFIDNPDVGLVVKTFLTGGNAIDRKLITNELEKLLKRYENRKCKVYLLHGDLSDEEMHSLYLNKSIHALVSLTHGEGFGLPLFEAAYSGLPVIATDWSGHLDFLYKPVKNKKGKQKNRPHFARIEYDVDSVPDGAVWDGVIQRDSMWAYPRQGSYKMKLREVYKDYSRFKSQAKKLKTWICDEFTLSNQNKKFADIVKEVIGYEDVAENLQDWFDELNVENYE